MVVVLPLPFVPVYVTAAPTIAFDGFWVSETVPLIPPLPASVSATFLVIAFAVTVTLADDPETVT